MAKKLTIADNTFLFTGKLTEFTREEAEAHVEAEGGKVLSGVSAKLNYLVVGEDAGSKLAKAEALGTITILTEKEFLKMVPESKPESTAKTTSNVKEISSFKYLSKDDFHSVFNNPLVNYSSYSRIILLITIEPNELEKVKKEIKKALSFSNYELNLFSKLGIEPFQFATTVDEWDDSMINLWVYYHSTSEFAYSNDTFRDLSGTLSTTIKGIEPDLPVYQGYESGDFDTGMYYAQNDGDFGMWNPWEDFNPKSKLNNDYKSVLKDTLKISPIKIDKK
jgi:hypothetical protein